MKLKQTIIGVMLGLLLVVLVVALVPVPGTTIMGDVDNDGRITVSDAQGIARVSSSLESSNCASDYDRNGRTNILDALKVAQISVGTRIHSTGTCDDPNKQFVCGDVNGDARVTQRDVDLLGDYVAGRPVPLEFTTACADVTSTTSGHLADGIINEIDAIYLGLYVQGFADLSFCNAPCRDPRTIPPPVPLRSPVKPS